MIYVLHGDDTESSYLRVLSIINKYPDWEKVNIANDQTFQLDVILTTEGIFESKKIIILEDFLKSKQFKPNNLKDTNDKILILWERRELAPRDVSPFAKIATIELFKPKTVIFSFLDSISPNATNTIRILETLKSENSQGVIFQLSNRLMLLILASAGYSKEEASKMSSRNLADWQWQRIKSQSHMLHQKVLIKLFQSTLKIDTLIKSGQTSHSLYTLLSLMFAKYLKAQP